MSSRNYRKMISNGFDTQEVMNALFGRIKWRSLNPGGTYPLNLQVGATRADFFIKAGTSTGLTVGGVTYSDSSLIGWTYRVIQLGYGPLQIGVDISVDAVNGGWTLINGSTFSLNQRFSMEFQPQQAVIPNTFSGRYWELFHPLVTLENLAAVIPEEISTGAAFTSWLTDLEQGMIMTLLNGIFDKPQLLEDTLIFDRQLRQDIPYGNAGKFVGYRLLIAPMKYAARIVKAGFIFNGAATFNLYIYQDMQSAPLYTQTVTTVPGQETLVDMTDWVIHYAQQNYSQGGVYYIGYYQNDLGAVQALDQFVSRWNDTYSFGYTAFEADQIPGKYDFNRIAVPYSFKTYGLNLRIEAYKDFTATIVKNASLFDEAMGLAMAIIAIGYQSYTTRTNFNERQLKDMAMTIYGEVNRSDEARMLNPYVAGLKQQLKRELYKINKNFFPDDKVITTRPAIYTDYGLQGIFP